MNRCAFVLLVLSSLSALACSKSPPEDRDAPSSASTPASGVVATAAQAPEPSDYGSPAETKPSPRTYARVLHTGDSMVGGGLARALRPKFEADGTKYYRDVIESGTIHEFSQSDHLPKLIAKIKPDLVLLTLGSNHVPHSVEPEKEVGPFLPKLLRHVAGIDCYWIAPPIWKASQAKFNQWLSEHIAPCRFYDASALDIERRPDKIHPNEKGGELWADDFWKFYKGDGAFLDTSPSLSPSPDASTFGLGHR